MLTKKIVDLSTDSLLRSPVQFMPDNMSTVSKLILIGNKAPTIQNLIEYIRDGHRWELVKYARTLKEKDKYDEWKSRATHCIVGSISKGNKLSEADIDYLTGWVYGDLDAKDISKLNFNVDLLKSQLYNKFPWIACIWKSFSGKGLGFLFYSDLIKTIDDYKSAYEQATDLIRHEFHIELDAKCKSPVRKLALSYDSLLLQREQIVSFPFDEYRTPANKRPQFDNYKVDASLFEDSDCQEKHASLNGKYYWSRVLSDKQSGEPIPYDGNIHFDNNIHSFTSCFEVNQITKTFHNRAKSVGYFPKGISCVRLSIHGMTKFYHGYRASSLCQIIFKYILAYCIVREKPILTKNEVYNILILLNKKCYDKYGKRKMPLEENELNKLASFIINTLDEQKLTLQINKKSSICTYSFQKQNKNNYLPALLRSVNEIRNEINNYYFIQSVENVLEEQASDNQRNLSCVKLAELLVNKVQLSEKSIQNKLYGLMKCDNFHLQYKERTIDNKDMENVTPLFMKWVRSQKDIDQLISERVSELRCLVPPIRITQSAVAKEIGYRRETVNRNWGHVEEIVRFHNSQVKFK